jgi:hypothetical protein
LCFFQDNFFVLVWDQQHDSPYNEIAGKTTYRLRLVLAPYQASVYAMFGAANNLPHVPAAYFNSYATDATLPPDENYYAQAPVMFNNLMLSSFLALGPDSSPGANTASVGDAIGDWSATSPLSIGVVPGPTEDFSFFWMDPTASVDTDYSSVGGPLIAQLTLPSDEPFFVKLGLQGKSMGDGADDWVEGTVIWMHAPDGVCPAGMTGEGCMTDVNECASNPCSDSIGSIGCWNGVNEWACMCADGSSDQTGAPEACDTNNCEAEEQTCSPFAVCTHISDGVHTCTCTVGYSSVDAGVTCSDIDECNSSPCANGAECADGVDSFSCACAAGYSGDTCADNIDECSSVPCLNGAACTDAVAAFSCTCAAGYHGPACGEDIDECGSFPCANDGACTDGIDTFTCACAAGYSDGTCTTDIDDCVSSPCVNGACTDGVNAFSCACAGGYSGDTCNININECGSSPCMNGADCTDGEDAYSCTCAAGFTNTWCSMNIDDCVPTVTVQESTTACADDAIILSLD